MSEPETAAGRRLLAAIRESRLAPMSEDFANDILAIEAELRASLAARLDTPPTSLSESAAFGWELARLRLIEGSDPASRSWPGRAEMEAMTDAEVNDFLESRGLDVRVIEGSDPANPTQEKP